jgi:hypothetical protein
MDIQGSWKVYQFLKWLIQVFFFIILQMNCKSPTLLQQVNFTLEMWHEELIRLRTPSIQIMADQIILKVLFRYFPAPVANAGPELCIFEGNAAGMDNQFIN